MEPVHDSRQREVEAFLSFVSNADTERAIRARSFHVLGHFAPDDFRALSDDVRSHGATASFAFLGRDAEEQGAAIADVHSAGHEVVIHGHRHVSFGDLDYDTAYGDLERGMNAIEYYSGVTPSGFFAPFKDVSEGTIEAAADLGLDWILGAPVDDFDGSPDLTLVDSVYPHDTRLLEDGVAPGDAFDELRESAHDGANFLFHPNLLDYYDATEEFDAWVESVEPMSVGDTVEAEAGVGMVLDCQRPLLIE